MALDPAWIGVVGTGGGAAIGALGSALVEWAKVATQGKQQRMADAARREYEAAEAKAVREADAAEAKAKRDADAAEAQAQRDAAQRTERAAQIREWREGLAAAHIEYAAWYAKRDAQGVSRVAEPNIVSAPWFQSLRRHLSSTTSAQLRTGEDIQCDSDYANVLASEIASIEEYWRLVD